jgi:hypothetical protein
MNKENDHAPDAPDQNDDMIEKIRDMVAKTTEEAIAPLRELLKTKEEEPPKGEDVGGSADTDTAHLREQRAAYERAGLHELMDFDEFIKGVEV